VSRSWDDPAVVHEEVGWSEHTVTVGERTVFYRRGEGPAGSRPIVHVHGFGISGSYLLPTARLLTPLGVNLVPDLPGYGRSPRPPHTLTIPELSEALLGFLDALGIDRAVLVGNSMGCPVILDLAHHHPERVDRLVVVAPAGGVHNQPLARAMVQLARDGLRESPRMARVAVPDYLGFGPVNSLRLFTALTRFPSLDRLLGAPVPSLAVLGSRDPLMPGVPRVLEVAAQTPPHVTLVVIVGAAHAVNFSHPGELAHVIRSWLEEREIVDDPAQPGLSRVIPVTRGG
jgi:pimeloyl-ACP methyl ester carboxylesterase